MNLFDYINKIDLIVLISVYITYFIWKNEKISRIKSAMRLHLFELKETEEIIEQLLSCEESYTLKKFYYIPTIKNSFFERKEILFDSVSQETFFLLNNLNTALNTLIQVQILLKTHYERYDENHGEYRYELYFNFLKNYILNSEYPLNLENKNLENKKKEIKDTINAIYSSSLGSYSPTYLREYYKNRLVNLKIQNFSTAILELEKEIQSLEKIKIWNIIFYYNK